jgi:hypothetical protein
MPQQLNVSTRITILLVFAVLFAATMIGLSIKSKTNNNTERVLFDSDKKYEKTFSVKTDGKLDIQTDVGNISIEGSDANEVKIRVIARGNDSELKKFDISFDQSGDVVSVKGKTRRSNFRFFDNRWLEIQYEIQVPKSFNLYLSTSGGNIQITDVKGKIDGETSGGNLELSQLDGKVRMSTSGGNVNIEKSTGEFNLETSGGNMYSESVTGPIHLETSGGNIEIKNSDGKLEASTSGGNIHAYMKDNKGIDLSTSGGNIVVRVPKSITADVQAEASGGDVSCDLEYTGKIKDGSMKGKINGGGNTIRLETSGGDIVIDPND